MRTLALLALLAGCKNHADDTGLPDLPDTGGPIDPVPDPNDQLSRPSEPTLSPDSFTSAQTCGACHQRHYREWSTSNHAYSITDPVFQALVGVRQADFDGREDAFCMQCHTAIGVRGGEVLPGFRFEDLSPIAQEGITCEACHKVSRIERLNNSGHVLDEGGPLRGPIRDPMNNPVHAAEYSPDFETSEFCAACHDIIELRGLPLERPYGEWTESPAADEGRACQTCHMPTYEGSAAPGAPARTLHEHRWVGVDVPMREGFANQAQRDLIQGEVEGLLLNAATVLLDAPTQVKPGEQLDLVVSVRNELDAHNLPTGSTFLRQLWLEVIATDAAGTVVYQTGTLDANDDLRNHYSALDPYGDADLITFTSSFVNADGAPELFPWRAAEHLTNALPPLYTRTYTLFIPTDVAAEGALTVQARLRLRPVPPFLLRALGLERYLDDVITYDIDANELQVLVKP